MPLRRAAQRVGGQVVGRRGGGACHNRSIMPGDSTAAGDSVARASECGPLTRGRKRKQQGDKTASPAPDAKRIAQEPEKTTATVLKELEDARVVGTCMLCLTPACVAAGACDTPGCQFIVCSKCVWEKGRQLASRLGARAARSFFPTKGAGGGDIRAHDDALIRAITKGDIETTPSRCPCGFTWRAPRGKFDGRWHVCEKTTLRQLMHGMCPVAARLPLDGLDAHTATCPHDFCQRREVWREQQREHDQRILERTKKQLIAQIMAHSMPPPPTDHPFHSHIL